MIVVVDTNILFSALLTLNSPFRGILLDRSHRFVAPNLIVLELFRHKGRVQAISALQEDELYDLFGIIINRIQFVNHDTVSASNWRAADELCSGIDEKDTPFVALALELDGCLWTGDKALTSGLRGRNFDRFFTP